MREEAADISQETLTELRTALEVQYQQVATKIVEETSGVTSAIEDMQVARQRVASWATPDDWSPLKKGIKRVYKQGRKALKRSQEAPTLENRHEWRKQVKYLWYQVRLLHPLWSPMMAALSEEMENSAIAWGAIADWSLLKQWLLEQWAAESETAAEELSGDRAALLAAIEQHQQRLQRKAERLGERIYAESPKQFVHRLKSYWQVWQQ
ncbi:MAG: CHAD domain-containing protein [Coleofasciculaceae cyanobacterium SM2_3_26]|nr:CHAD domain-containing protein [Coleofasciculaceae cyanobacterium SM2_3_26]